MSTSTTMQALSGRAAPPTRGHFPNELVLRRVEDESVIASHRHARVEVGKTFPLLPRPPRRPIWCSHLHGSCGTQESSRTDGVGARARASASDGLPDRAPRRSTREPPISRSCARAREEATSRTSGTPPRAARRTYHDHVEDSILREPREVLLRFHVEELDVLVCEFARVEIAALAHTRLLLDLHRLEEAG